VQNQIFKSRLSEQSPRAGGFLGITWKQIRMGRSCLTAMHPGVSSGGGGGTSSMPWMATVMPARPPNFSSSRGLNRSVTSLSAMTCQSTHPALHQIRIQLWQCIYKTPSFPLGAPVEGWDL